MPDTHNLPLTTRSPREIGLPQPRRAPESPIAAPIRTGRSQSGAALATHPERVQRPALLHYAALLSGFGTAFLGPSLPVLAGTLHLSDSMAGMLFAAQFTGAFLGGWLTEAPLRRCMLRGYTAASIGFAGLAASLALHAPLLCAVAVLLVLGFGVGQIITSNNLLASLLWSHRRGAALTLLNFTWSAGALCSPLFLPALLRARTPASLFASFAGLLAVGLLAVLTMSPARIQEPGAVQAETTDAGLTQRAFLYFCLQLLVYGGVETSLDGWLTTYDLRYTNVTHTFAASTAAFWFCLTATRAAASALLLRVPEQKLLRGGLLLAAITLAVLLAVGHGSVLPVLAGLTGAALAPWFPLLFSRLVGTGPTATQAGRIVAVSGLGAAALPWLVGRVSTATGSLRMALTLPIAGVLALLLLSFRRDPIRPAV